ncbi:hypothetical protein H6768_01405 [Candidatus Peribacteria bacterium]|nr:hypothetical protein [Candidatus Peribacteria bacterium]
MKKKNFCLGKWKIATDTLHWIGFGIVASIIIVLTAYGFSLSLNPNSGTFDSAPEAPLAIVGVALANNIGAGTARASEIPVNLPADVSVVQNALIRDGISGSSFFDEHFLRMSELTELLNIDVVSYLHLHADKSASLEKYITQLEEKKQEANDAYLDLAQLNTLHKNAYTSLQEEIKTTQSLIENAYNNHDGDSIMQGLTQLEELHTEEQEHKNISVFATRIGTEYKTLITAAEQKLSVLRANIDPLVKGVTVKLPQGIDINALKNLQLFATETK